MVRVIPHPEAVKAAQPQAETLKWTIEIPARVVNKHCPVEVVEHKESGSAYLVAKDTIGCGTVIDVIGVLVREATEGEKANCVATVARDLLLLKHGARELHGWARPLPKVGEEFVENGNVYRMLSSFQAKNVLDALNAKK